METIHNTNGNKAFQENISKREEQPCKDDKVVVSIEDYFFFKKKKKTKGLIHLKMNLVLIDCV